MHYGQLMYGQRMRASRKDSDSASNERFLNRRIGFWEAVVEAVAVSALFAAWIYICAIA